MIIRELITRLGFDLDDTEAKEADRIFKNLSVGALSLVGLFGAATTALVALVKSVSDNGDRVAKAGQKLGITAQNVQELEYAAGNSGVAIGTLHNSLTTMLRKATEAARGSKEAASGFAQLGVHVRGANGQIKPGVDLLQEVAEKIAATKDPAKKATLAMAVFGRGSASMVPLLNEGSKGIEKLRQRANLLGAVIDNKTASAAEELNDAFTDMGLIVKGVAVRFGVALQPAMQQLLDSVVKNDGLITRIAETTGEWATVLADLIEYLFKLGRLIDKHRVFFAAFLVVALLPTVLQFYELAKAINLASKAWKFLQSGIKKSVFILAALAIAYLVEDIYYFATGGNSALGSLRKAFNEEAAKPGANWMVKTLNLIIEKAARGVESIDSFFKAWADAAADNNEAAIIKLFDDLNAKIFQGFADIGRALVEFFSGKFLLDLGQAVGDPVIGFFSDLAKEAADAFVNKLAESFGVNTEKFRKAFDNLVPPEWRDTLDFVLGRKAYVAGAGLVSTKGTDFLGPNFTTAIEESLGPSRPTFTPQAISRSVPTNQTTVQVGGAQVSVTVNGDADAKRIAAEASSGVEAAHQKAGAELASRFRGNR